MEVESLITAFEAGAILGVDRRSALNWARAGRFPAVKIAENARCEVYRFRRSDLAAYLDRSRLSVREGDGDAGQDR